MPSNWNFAYKLLFFFISKSHAYFYTICFKKLSEKTNPKYIKLFTTFSLVPLIKIRLQTLFNLLLKIMTRFLAALISNHWPQPNLHVFQLKCVSLWKQAIKAQCHPQKIGCSFFSGSTFIPLKRTPYCIPLKRMSHCIPLNRI